MIQIFSVRVGYENALSYNRALLRCEDTKPGKYAAGHPDRISCQNELMSVALAIGNSIWYNETGVSSSPFGEAMLQQPGLDALPIFPRH